MLPPPVAIFVTSLPPVGAELPVGAETLPPPVAVFFTSLPPVGAELLVGAEMLPPPVAISFTSLPLVGAELPGGAEMLLPPPSPVVPLSSNGGIVSSTKMTVFQSPSVSDSNNVWD
jgi:hypothetical protein